MILENLLLEIQNDTASGNYARAIEKILTSPTAQFYAGPFVQQAILPLLNLEHAYHIVIFGDFASGKTEFKVSICNFFSYEQEVRVLFDEMTDVFGFDMSCIKLDELTFVFLWSPANTSHWTSSLFQPILQTDRVLGCVALIDSKTLPSFRANKLILDRVVRQNDKLFGQFLPYVIVATKQDLPEAWSLEDLRIVFRIRKDEKFLSCNAQDKESVKRVLLELLYSVRENIKD